MAEGLGGITKVFEEHPMIIGLLVAGVAVIAYLQSGKSQQGSSDQEYSGTFAGGGAARPIDPYAAAISQAAISAGSQNLSTIAGLVGLEDSNASDLAGNLASVSAGRDVAIYGYGASRDTALGESRDSLTSSLASTAAARDVGLATIGAQRDVGLAGIGANQETTDRQTDAGVTISGYNNTTQQHAADVTASMQTGINQTNAQIAKLNADNQNFAIQADKDKARAAANAGIVNGIIHLGGELLGFFGF